MIIIEVNVDLDSLKPVLITQDNGRVKECAQILSDNYIKCVRSTQPSHKTTTFEEPWTELLKQFPGPPDIVLSVRRKDYNKALSLLPIYKTSSRNIK